MLKKEHLPLYLYLSFCFLMREYMGPATLGLAVVGAICLFTQFELSKLIRTVCALGIFASYWLIYGKVIDPEVGLNFLTSVIMLKMLEKNSRRDDYMIFFGLILLLSAGSLFEKNLTYVFFYMISFMLLIYHFYSHLKISWRLKDLVLSLLWATPLTLALFFLAPRILSPLPFQQQGLHEGRVGYTPDLSLSDLEELSSNETPAFQAQISKELTSDELYWRGNVLSFNDGWNWTSFRGGSSTLMGEFPKKWPGVKQEIRLLTQEDFFFALDRPSLFGLHGEIHSTGDTYTLPQRSSRFVGHYQVYSEKGSLGKTVENAHTFLRVILPESDKAWIRAHFKGISLEEISEEVKAHFRTGEFQYSYAPGKIPSFRSFMEKKIGLCSHYASALGLILRVKGIPARLVSGFMGGNYNPYAGFYLITQNEAHTWVEAFSDGKWMRVDPTIWIAPDRMTSNAGAFVESRSAQSALVKMNFKLDFGWFQEIKLWFNQWDYRFYRWLDQLDYYGQGQLLTSWKLKREWLYWITPSLILGFALIYFVQLHRLSKEKVSELELLWSEFQRKCKKRGLTLHLRSLSHLEDNLHRWEHADRHRFIEIFQRLVSLSFANRETSTSEIKEELRSL